MCIYHRQILQEQVCEELESRRLDHLKQILTECVTILLQESYMIANHNLCSLQVRNSDKYKNAIKLYINIDVL